MYIIKLTNIYFTLNFRCQNVVGCTIVVSGIFEILLQRGRQAGGWPLWEMLPAEMVDTKTSCAIWQ